MGSWSYICKGGCGAPISEGEDAVGVGNAVYEGYGRVGEGDVDHVAIYHRACFAALVAGASGALLDFSPGERDPDQGFGYPDPRFVREGTVLYDPALGAVGGRGKVGVLVDVSGSSPVHDDARCLVRVAGLLDQAFHYLGVDEVELVFFDDRVQGRETVDAKGLYRRLVRGKWEGRGGDGVAAALRAAEEAGCGAAVVVSDGAHSTWPDAAPGIPVVHLRLVDSERGLGSAPPGPAWAAGSADVAFYRPLTDAERGEIEARVEAGQP